MKVNIMLTDDELKGYITKVIERMENGYTSSFQLDGLGKLFYTLGDIKDRDDYYTLGNTIMQIGAELNPNNETAILHYLVDAEKKDYLSNVANVLKDLPSALSDEVKVLKTSAKLYKVCMDLLWRKGDIKINPDMYQ